MKKLGRKRFSRNIPAHIDAAKLPERVWFNVSGSGKWMLNYYDDTGKRLTRRLCGPEAKLAEIWQAVEANQVKTVATFATLSAEFQQTHQWHKLSPLTQKDYLFCRQAIITRDTTNGKLGDVPLSQWTIGLIRKYRDKRAEDSESRANKELSYIKRVFSWGYEYEKVSVNPAAGIKKIALPPRQHYTEDRDYYYMLNIARQSGYYYVYFAMELAFLCRMRLCEVLSLNDAQELENGLLIKRRKGSRTNITEWNDRLRAIWDDLKQKRAAIFQDRRQPSPIRAEDRYLFVSEHTGDRINDHTFKTAWQRVMKMAEEQAKKEGVEFTRFTFHDLKKKSISDFDGDKMAASGHRTQAMVNLYDLSIPLIKPTRD